MALNDLTLAATLYHISLRSLYNLFQSEPLKAAANFVVSHVSYTR